MHASARSMLFACTACLAQRKRVCALIFHLCERASPAPDTQDGAVLRTALRRKHATYPELADGRAQALCVLGCEVGGRWSTDAVMLVRRLVALRALKAPPAMRPPTKAAWARRWWSVLSVAVQQAVGHTALGRARAMPGPAHTDAPDLSEVLDLADPEGPSRLPLRG